MKKKPIIPRGPSDSFETLKAEMPIRRIQLNVQQFTAQQGINETAFGLSMERMYDAVGENLVMQLKARIASKKFDYKKVSFPDGAVQACKFALKKSAFGGTRFVRWLLKRYPVRMVEIEMEANAYHPDIAIPDHATFVEICMMERYKNG